MTSHYHSPPPASRDLISAAFAGDLELMRTGTDFLLGYIAGLDDDAFPEPSGLPGWSRSVLLAHVARNADALGRLVSWARTGIQTPMYSSAAQRGEEIAASARRSPHALRRDVAGSASRLAEAVDALPRAAWTARVRTAKGRLIPATGIPWLRVREVWLHAVDLRSGAAIDQLPPPLLSRLIGEVTQMFDARDDVAPLRLEATDVAQVWQIHAAATNATTVRSSLACLLGWLTGRPIIDSMESDGSVPALPAWL